MSFSWEGGREEEGGKGGRRHQEEMAAIFTKYSLKFSDSILVFITSTELFWDTN